jgi:hypothetical protein
MMHVDSISYNTASGTAIANVRVDTYIICAINSDQYSIPRADVAVDPAIIYLYVLLFLVPNGVFF